MGTRTPTRPKRELVIHFTISRSNLSLRNSEKLKYSRKSICLADIETMAPFGKHALGIGHCNLLHWQFWPPIWHLAHSGTSLRFCNDTSELNLALSVDLDAPETKLRLLQIVKKVQPPAYVAIDISNCAIICPMSQCASLPIEVLLPRSWPVPNRMALQGP